MRFELNVDDPSGNEDDDALDPPGPRAEAMENQPAAISEGTIERQRDETARRYAKAADRGRSERGRRRRRKRRREWVEKAAARLDRLPLETWLLGLFGITVAGSVLALGGVQPWVMAIVGVLSAMGLAIATWLRTAESPSVAGPGLLCWLLAGWSLIQLIPLPIAWLHALAPTNADIWERALIPLGETGPAFASISLDPGATMIEATRWFSYGAVFTMAARIAERRSTRWVIGAIFATAVVTALITLGHGLAGMDKVYGLYEPSFKVNTWRVGPLLNPNNLAGVLNLGALSGLGLMLTAEKNRSPWPIISGVAIIVAVSVISASRGGVALLVVGVILVAGSTELRSRESLSRSSKLRARVMVLATLAAGVVFALLGGRTAIWNELLDENMEKLRHVGFVEPALADFPILGMGRGSFESVFPAYQTQGGGIVYTHAENFVVHWVVEWGAPVALLALLVFAFFLRPKRMGVTRSTLSAAVWIGVLMVLLQNLMDLGMEVPGVCMVIAASLGALWGDPHRFEVTRRRRMSRRWSLRWATIALVSGVGLAGVAFASGRHTVAQDRIALAKRLTSQKPPRPADETAALRAGLKDAMLRHPAEPFFSLLGAELAWEERTGDAIPWLQRALERSAFNGRAHLLLARVLKRHGAHNQALLELRLAAEIEQRLVGAAAKHAVSWTTDVAQLERAAPNNDDAALFWDAVGAFVSDRKLARTFDDKALTLDATRVGPHTRLARDLIKSRVEQRGCQDDDEADCAEKLATHATAIDAAGGTSVGTQLRAQWLSAIGDHVAAEELLAEACDKTKDAMKCLRVRAAIAAKISTAEPFGDTAKALRRATCAKRDACAEVNAWIGDLHMQRKEHALAVTAYEKAVREHATEERLLKLADAATEAGLASRALRALERLIERTDDADAKAKLKTRRQAVIGRMLR